ncbi:branched-chain amino acid ABC transporter, permease [Deferribacter desulfuricans SSM1]|uniref:Branched-chain amino acid ABC transporter, permease n=1 Tax=Deferribacter desulfuricans (strain DSM 14783 / JCM 11476 / NBRC 101012 / SSM1) TaxID=639282 RepID=D3PC13_DEFDS|nr:branched-chain amino acid ABC transporter permease [Deferribacter desulfuricans]BAI80136.1 branched-chain amino acid ABC transporter, permease [Deferribacter desulfuricans SSM1]
MDNKKTLIGFLIFIIFLIVFPFMANSRWLAVGTTFIIYSIVALSQDIVLGRAGMFDMGHALFFGLGAYSTAILNTVYNVPVMWTIPVAVLLPMVFGVLLAAPIIHLRGDYLLVTTIGFNIVFEQVLKNNLFGITGGPNGIFGIGVPSIFGFQIMTQQSIYYMSFVVLMLTFFIIRNLETSKIGRALHYLNEDSLAAECVGINTRFYRLYAFGLGAALAGLAGVLFAVQYAAVSPEAFSFIQSVLFFTIVIVGGPSSIPGILIGTFVMFVLPEIFRQFATARYFVFGIAMILTMILRPRGVWPAKFGRIPKYIMKD